MKLKVLFSARLIFEALYSLSGRTKPKHPVTSKMYFEVANPTWLHSSVAKEFYLMSDVTNNDAPAVLTAATFVLTADSKFVGTFLTTEEATTFGAEVPARTLQVLSTVPGDPEQNTVVSKFEGTVPPRTYNRLPNERIEALCKAVVGKMEEGETYKRAEFMEALEITTPEWTKVSKKLLEDGLVEKIGIKRGACYHIAGHPPVVAAPEAPADPVTPVAAAPVTPEAAPAPAPETQEAAAPAPEAKAAPKAKGKGKGKGKKGKAVKAAPAPEPTPEVEVETTEGEDEEIQDDFTTADFEG